MQGNCSIPPDLQLGGPPLVGRLPGQCVLVADMDLWEVRHGRLWIHNLYLRRAVSARDDFVALVYTSQYTAWLWVTQVTIQGAGQYAGDTGARALYVQSPTYVEGAPLCAD